MSNQLFFRRIASSIGTASLLSHSFVPYHHKILSLLRITILG
jgi:hypothetical protein